MKLYAKLRAARSLRVTLLASVLSLALGAQVQAASEIVPGADETPPISISVGETHNIAYNADGMVWYWSGVTFFRPEVKQGLGEVASISSGGSTDLILRKDGTVWEWGALFVYTDGRNGTYEFPAPKQVKGLSNIIKITALHNINAAIDKNGSVWVWFTSPDRTDPVRLQDVTKAKDIAINGVGEVLILKDDGTVWKWAADTNLSSAAIKMDTLSDIVAFSHGNSRHSFAIKKDGTVWGWGNNGNGELGLDLGIHNTPSPVRIESLTNVESISTGSYRSLVVKKDGTVWLLGLEIGYDTHTYFTKPTQVDGLENVSSVALGGLSALAVTNDGKLLSWGSMDNSSYHYVEQPTPVILPPKAGPPQTYSSSNIGIKINGYYTDINPKATIVNENTFIPLRGIMDAIGGKLTWLSETQSIVIERGSKKITLKVGSKEAVVNGSAITLDNAPFISDAGSTYVPLRFISEAIGAQVIWDPEHWTVVLEID